SRIEELKDQSVRLRTILDGMSEGVALIEDGVIEVANPAFARLLGVEAMPHQRASSAAQPPSSDSLRSPHERASSAAQPPSSDSLRSPHERASSAAQPPSSDSLRSPIEGKTPLEAARVPGLADAIDAAARERRESER